MLKQWNVRFMRWRLGINATDGATLERQAEDKLLGTIAGFTDAGASWQDLGAFQIHSGTAAVQLSNAANGFIDAGFSATGA